MDNAAAQRDGGHDFGNAVPARFGRETVGEPRGGQAAATDGHGDRCRPEDVSENGRQPGGERRLRADERAKPDRTVSAPDPDENRGDEEIGALRHRDRSDP